MDEGLILSFELRAVEDGEEVYLEEGVGGWGHEGEEVGGGDVFGCGEGGVEGCRVEGEGSRGVDWVACIEGVVSVVRQFASNSIAHS